MNRIIKLLVLVFIVFSCSKSDDEPIIDRDIDKDPEIDVETLYEGYYSSIDDFSAEALRSELHSIVRQGHKFLLYTSSSTTDVWDALEKTDEDPANPDNIILIYTGRSIPKSNKSKSGQPDYWNREHVWAKSRGDFGTSPGAGTDIHHIRPADASVNSDRGNKYFDTGGSEHPEAIGCRYDSDSWEPRDEVKGDVARMLFYMAVRYDSEDGVDLELTNRTYSDYKLPFHGFLSTLLEWHDKDPVDESEKRRNEMIYTIQGNRNPFIDFPEFVDMIWE